MKVLFFTPAFEEGGGERLYVNLLRGLPRAEVDATLVCWKVHDSHFVQELPSDVPIHDLHRTGRWRNELPRLVRETRRLIDTVRPDVVMAISTEVNWALWLAQRLSQTRPPIVLNEQGSTSGWLSVLRPVSPLRARLVALGYRRVYLRTAARVVCVSEAVRRDLIEEFGAAPARLVTIPNPLDIEGVRTAAAEPFDEPWPTDGRPLVVSAGRFFHQKGYDVLLRAFARVARATDARLALVGDGPERAALEQLAAGLDIGDRCTFVGYRDNPFPALARGTVFAMPSRAEGFGYVLVEAMALGVPVVTTDAAGPAEIADGGRFGEVVPIDDEEALAVAIIGLLEHPERRRALAAAARNRVEEYSADHVVERYLDLFHGVVAA
jgi:glycosyltransferase involved in cell wall biosynthesis